MPAMMAAPTPAATAGGGTLDCGTKQGVPPAPEAAPEKAEFKVTLAKFDPASKAKIIREIKNVLPGMSLVEAKAFVESAPKVIKEKVRKEEAEQLKKTLEELGASIQLE